MKISFKRLALASTALMLAWPATAPRAQTGGLEEIIVTARQRQENLTEIPLAITTFSAESIDERQLRDISDLTRFTPGFSYRAQNTQNGARVLPAYRFRGMNAGVGQSLAQLGAVFVDGLYLLGGAQSLTFDDVERIEVIKGPQSAYFGRSTFGGAVNFITRQPKDHWGARVSASVESYDGRTLSASVDGPLMGDKLSMRLSGTSNQVGAHYKASDGGKLGRQKTDSLNAQLVAKPTDNLTLRVRYTYTVDDDSSPAIVDLNASKPNIEGNAAECLRGTLKYWCGELPKMGAVGVPSSVIDTSTSFVTPAFARSNSPNIIADILSHNANNPLTRLDFALHDRLPDLDHTGMRATFNWITAEANYEFGDGYNLHGAFGDSTKAILSVAGLLQDGAAVSILPGIFENTEGEIRLSSPGDKRFTWLVGANVFRQQELGIPTSGFAVRVDTNNNIVYSAPQFYAAQSKVNYFGVFAGAHYAILDNLNIDLEGRWQRDRVTSSFQAPTQSEVVFKAFAPRAILTWHPMQDFTVYGSWARGVNPGFTNATVPLLSAALQATVKADPGYVPAVGAEKLDSFELGVKQQISWLRYSVAAYYAKWNNLKNQVNFACPGAVCGPGFFAPFASFYAARTGSLKGIEIEGTASINDHWDVDFTFERTWSRFDSFSSPTGLAATGLTFANNLKIFEYPEAQASLATTYRVPINADYNAYIRAEATYTGKSYVDEFNQSWIGDYAIANMRVGVSAEGKRLELYVTNLFDQNQWLSGRRGSGQIDPRPAVATNYPTAFLVPARKRSFGIRASYEF